MHSIETIGLTHHFGQETALDNVNLAVPQGAVYGFLGPNGAGKTTTLKLLLGLLKKQQGEIRIFGRPFRENRVALLRQIGSLIESPSFYGQLTARENLDVFRRIYRCTETRIGETLELVGLAHTGKKAAGKFSLGMKQRLGIAIALLHEPSLLILDEPTNGLDPNGMVEMRHLLRRLNTERRMTILVSSHLLAEIEKTVTHLGIIHNGMLRFQGTIAELHAMQAEQARVRFETSDPQRAAEIFTSAGCAPVRENGHVMVPVPDQQQVAELNRRLVGSGIDVYQVTTQKNDLESIFMNVLNTKP